MKPSTRIKGLYIIPWWQVFPSAIFQSSNHTTIKSFWTYLLTEPIVQRSSFNQWLLIDNNTARDQRWWLSNCPQIHVVHDPLTSSWNPHVNVAFATARQQRALQSIYPLPLLGVFWNNVFGNYICYHWHFIQY